MQQTASEPPQQGGLQASQEPSSICLPRFFADLDSKQIDEFLVMMWSLDSRVYGACAATCWMKQVGWRWLAMKAVLCGRLRGVCFNAPSVLLSA